MLDLHNQTFIFMCSRECGPIMTWIENQTDEPPRSEDLYDSDWMQFEVGPLLLVLGDPKREDLLTAYWSHTTNTYGQPSWLQKVVDLCDAFDIESIELYRILEKCSLVHVLDDVVCDGCGSSFTAAHRTSAVEIIKGKRSCRACPKDGRLLRETPRSRVQFKPLASDKDESLNAVRRTELNRLLQVGTLAAPTTTEIEGWSSYRPLSKLLTMQVLLHSGECGVIGPVDAMSPRLFPRQWKETNEILSSLWRTSLVVSPDSSLDAFSWLGDKPTSFYLDKVRYLLSGEGPIVERSIDAMQKVDIYLYGVWPPEVVAEAKELAEDLLCVEATRYFEIRLDKFRMPGLTARSNSVLHSALAYACRMSTP
jgi:hypothetical protein